MNKAVKIISEFCYNIIIVTPKSILILKGFAVNTEAKHYFVINPRGFANEGHIIRTNNPDIIKKYIDDNTATELTEEEAVNLAVYWSINMYLENMYGNLDKIKDIEEDDTEELVNTAVREKAKNILIDDLNNADCLEDIRYALIDWDNIKANDGLSTDDLVYILEESGVFERLGLLTYSEVDEEIKPMLNANTTWAYNKKTREVLSNDGGWYVYALSKNKVANAYKASAISYA